jgi:hypothetical protein
LLYASSELRLPTDGVKDCMPTSHEGMQVTRDRVRSKFPFLDYALEGMLYHADSMLGLGHEDT